MKSSPSFKFYWQLREDLAVLEYVAGSPPINCPDDFEKWVVWINETYGAEAIERGERGWLPLIKYEP